MKRAAHLRVWLRETRAEFAVRSAEVSPAEMALATPGEPLTLEELPPPAVR